LANTVYDNTNGRSATSLLTLLMELSDGICDFVADLFNKSLKTSDIPQDWMLADVSPVFKYGKKSNTLNYCQISLAVNFCKNFVHWRHNFSLMMMA